jgi:cysteine desulfurase/selenocysteine lyase
MIETVELTGSTFAPPPARFEAGTPPIAQAVGLGAAVDYLSAIGMEAIEAREQELLAYALPRLDAVPGLRVIGRAAERAAVISFLVEGAHAHDLATLLDLDGIAVRSGHHCAHPLMQFYGVPATCRASIAFYNTRDEIDALVEGIAKARRLLG